MKVRLDRVVMGNSKLALLDSASRLFAIGHLVRRLGRHAPVLVRSLGRHAPFLHRLQAYAASTCKRMPQALPTARMV